MKTKKPKIYRCKLLSVTENMKVYNGYSRKQNIKQAYAEGATLPVETLYVDMSSGPEHVREVITKKLIPVYRIRIITGDELEDIVEHYPPKNWACFIIYTEKIKMDMHSGFEDLDEASADELQQYYDIWQGEDDPTVMHDRLEELFLKGEAYYQAAAKNPVPSEDERKANLVSSNSQGTKRTVLQKIIRMYH